MDPIIMNKIIRLVNVSSFSDVDKSLRQDFVETDEFYVLVRDYYNLYYKNSGSNLDLEIPEKIQELFSRDDSVKDFLLNL